MQTKEVPRVEAHANGLGVSQLRRTLPAPMRRDLGQIDGFPYTGHLGGRRNGIQFIAWERCFVRALPDGGAPYEPEPILARPNVAARTALNIREENFVMVDGNVQGCWVSFVQISLVPIRFSCGAVPGITLHLH